MEDEREEGVTGAGLSIVLWGSLLWWAVLIGLWRCFGVLGAVVAILGTGLIAWLLCLAHPDETG